MAYKEYLLTTDKFSNPAVLTGSAAYGVLLLRLLMLEPGTNPLHPKMGVGLGPKYRYMTSDSLPELQTNIQTQINTYLPSDFSAKVEVVLSITSQGYLVIAIVANDTKYVYDTENSSTPIQISN